MSTHQNEKSARISSLAKSFKSHLMPNVRWLHRRVAANLFEFICIYGLFMHTIQLDFVLFALLSPLANKNQQHRTSHQFRAMSTVIGHCRESERERESEMRSDNRSLDSPLVLSVSVCGTYQMTDHVTLHAI